MQTSGQERSSSSLRAGLSAFFFVLTGLSMGALLAALAAG